MFSVFSECRRRGHYKVYCNEGDTEWYLFDDDKTTKKRGEIALINTKENIVARVTLLHYFKNEEAKMRKLAERAQEKLVQEVDHGYDVGMEESKEMLVQEVDHGYDVGTEESKPSIVKDLAQI